MLQPTAVDKTAQLQSLLDERILILDGAMGTQIQALGLDEAAVRGERFADSPQGSQELRRHPLPHAAQGHHGDPRPLLRGRRRHRRNQHVRREPGGHGRVRPAGGADSPRSTPPPWPALAEPRTSGPSARPIARGSSPARSARRPSRRPSARRSTTPRTAARRSTKWPSRTTPRSRRWSKPASTSCCPRRSSTRSTSRRACSPSRNTSTTRACACPSWSPARSTRAAPRSSPGSRSKRSGTRSRTSRCSRWA